MKKFTLSLLCLVTALVTGSIGAVTPPIITSLSSTQVTCAGGNTGSLTVTAASGLRPYSVTILGRNTGFTAQQAGTTAQTQFVFSNVPADIYDASVVDSNTPPLTDAGAITVSSFAPVVVTLASFVHPTCFNSTNGSIVVNATGGPFPGTNFLYNISGTTTLVPDGTSHTFTNLQPGDYTVTVLPVGATLAGAACAGIAEITLQAPAQLVIAAAVPTPPTCNGGLDGSLIITLTGGAAPFTVTLTGPTLPAPGITITQPSPIFTFNNLRPGAYTINATDANNCPANAISQTIGQPQTVLSINLAATLASITPTTCPGGSDGSLTIVATDTSVPPLTLEYALVAPSQNLRDFQASPIFNNLEGGSYTVEARNAAAPNLPCAIASVVVPSPDPIVITPTITNVDIINDTLGAVKVTVTGGTPPYAVTLTPGGQTIQGTASQSVFTFNNLAVNTYTVSVVDANDCPQSITVVVKCVRGPSTNALTNFFTLLCNGSCTPITT